MKFKFNKSKVIPSVSEYFKILISAFITVFLLKKPILYLIPQINNLSSFWSLVFWILVITYLKNLFDIKIGKHDYF